MKPFFPIKISGTGSYVPKKVLTNQYFVDRLDTSEEWILTRTGIRERRQAAPDEHTSMLGANAAKEALRNAGLTINDIDVLLCATATGDCQFPATATFIQEQLGGANIPAFDVGAACAGFLYGTSVAIAMLKSGMYRRALVIGAEALTRFVDYEDRSTCILFGDAAGAAIMERSDEDDQGVLYYNLGCDGKLADLIQVPAGGARLPSSSMTVAERLHFLHMRGREVYKFVVVKMQQMIDEALTTTGLKAEDLKLVIPHQSNFRILESVRTKLGLPREKLVVNIDRYGNTSSASVIMGLDEARRNGTLTRGDLVMLTAVGSGLCWGTMIVRL